MSILFTAIYIFAISFGALVIFGLPYFLNGKLAVAHWRKRAENRFVTGVVLTAAFCVVSAPLAFSALISGGAHVQVIAQQVLGMSWQG